MIGLPMKQYERFIFESFGFDEETRQISLSYSLDGAIPFTETITLPKGVIAEEVDAEAFERALFNLHLIGGISYFKTCLPKTIEIHSGTLTKEQAAFWTKVYEDGLGEFFFRNELDPHDRVHFPATAGEAPEIASTVEHAERKPLVPIGGGKDSVVTMELLKKAGYDLTLLRVGEHPLITDMAQEGDFPLLSVKRALSPELFKLNEEGALNGHVPISAYISFLAVAIAILSGHTDVIFSNERSANEGNVEYKGKTINHQWSKSLEFERMFQDYLAAYVTKDVQYFSLLRRYSELKIVEVFLRYPKYLDLFTSCNRNWHLVAKKEMPTLWCGECPKCAFAFALLAAYLPKDRLVGLFGKDLFEDQKLVPLYKELLGIDGFKPFECVGTADEVKAAFLLAQKRGEFDGTSIMKLFETTKATQAMVDDAMASSDDHAIPKEFLSLVP